MIIVGLAGKAGAGKDTAYLLMKEVLEGHGLKTQKISFAGKLKDICTHLFKWDRERLDYDAVYKESSLLDNGEPDPACQMLGKSRRVVMQEIGTEAMRQGLHQDVWIIAQKLAIMSGEYDGVDVGFITDCRFMNEIQFVHDMSGIMVRVDRTDQGTLTSNTAHASENEWTRFEGWDYVVQNDFIAGREVLKNSLVNILRAEGIIND